MKRYALLIILLPVISLAAFISTESKYPVQNSAEELPVDSNAVSNTDTIKHVRRTSASTGGGITPSGDIVSLPEPPVTEGFVPTMLSDLQAADPAANLSFILPPSAAQNGLASLQYPLQMPPARNGMQPQLAVVYNSDMGSGILGKGWDVPTSSIIVDTRWGVPRYLANKESETYLLDGMMLCTSDANAHMHVGHRGEMLSRNTSGTRLFVPRREKEFSRIERKGTTPGTYYWEVTDNRGTKYTYGATADSRLAGVVTDANNQTRNVIAEWRLCRIEELHGDYVTFHYTEVQESVLGGMSSKALYLYQVKAGSPEFTTPHTLVCFHRSNSVQSVRHSSARYGFLTSSNSLLDSISVTYRNEPFRGYKFHISEGTFHQERLDSIIQYDADGHRTSFQKFDYYDDTEGGTRLFANQEVTLSSGSGGDGAGLLALNSLQSGHYSGRSTMIGATKTHAEGGSFYAGVGISDGTPGKGGTVGGSVSYNQSTTEGIATLVDINGDGLPDKVYSRDGHLYFRPQTITEGMNGFGNELPINGCNSFLKTKSTQFGGGIKGHVSLGGSVTGVLGGDYGHFSSTTTNYMSDVNNDGLTDIVSGNRVYFNRLINDIPTFATSSALTPNPVVGGGDVSNSLYTIDQNEQDTLVYYSPMHDIVRVWKAPRAGTVSIRSFITLLPPSDQEEIEGTLDGINATIQVQGNVVASKSISADNHDWQAFHAPSTIAVGKNDLIFFRLQSGTQEYSNGCADRVIWNDTITYINEQNKIDANGMNTSIFASSEDLPAAHVIVPVNGKSFKITGKITKPVLNDNIFLRVYTFNSHHSENKYLTISNNVAYNLETSSVRTLNISNTRQDSLVYCEIFAYSNVDWNKVRWDAKVVVAGDDGMNDTIPITPRYHTYEKINNALSSYFVQQSGDIQIRPRIDFSETANGNFYIRIKGNTPIIRKSYEVVNGNYSDTTFISIPINRPIWIEAYCDESLVNSIQGMATAEIKIPGEEELQLLRMAVYTHTERNDTLGFGQMYRGWGRFVYNAAQGRYASPIDLSLLSADYSNRQDDINPLTEASLQMSVGTDGQHRWLGSNANIWLSGDTMSTARLVQNEVRLTNPLEDIASPANYNVTGFPFISKGHSWDIMAGINGPVSGTINNASGQSYTEMSVQDMNGDGYPDLVSQDHIAFTNAQGSFSGETISAFAQSADNSSNNISRGGNPVFSRTTSHGKSSDGTTAQSIDMATGGNTTESVGSFDFSNATNQDDMKGSYIDINGDGLPDYICKNSNGCFFRLNLGYSFSANSYPLNTETIESSSGISYTPSTGIQLPLCLNKWAGSFMGGIGVAASDNRQECALLDVNGDGLPDLIKTTMQGDYSVYLNTGNGFASRAEEIADLDALSQNTALSTSANAAFSTSFVLFGVKVTINPGAFHSRSINRNLLALRDFDGDGYFDMLRSDSEDQLTVRYSAIRRTGKLKSVRNSLGGTFTLDYALTTPTYGMPSGKWVLSEVTIDDGIHDDGPARKTRYEYENGQYERHEREFLGFGSVRTMELDTNNGATDSLYRQTVTKYDVSSYYTQGNILSETVMDATGNKYTETTNKYYNYYVRTNSNQSYLMGTTSTDDLSDAASLYAPLKFTETKQYEGNNGNGKIMSQSYFSYSTINSTRGAMTLSCYSDKGTLTETGTGWDYKKTFVYVNSTTRNVLRRPFQMSTFDNNGTRIQYTLYSYRSDNNLLLPTFVKKQINANQFAQMDLTYDNYGNLLTATLPANLKDQRMCYNYTYDDIMHMYVTRITDRHGYTSYVDSIDYRYGLPLDRKDTNGMPFRTYVDGMGRTTRYVGPAEQSFTDGTAPEYGQMLDVYTVKYEYQPIAELSADGHILRPAYSLTRHYDTLHHGNSINTYTFVDGFGRPIQVKKDAVIANDSGQKTLCRVNSGRIVYDAFGREAALYYPIVDTVDSLLFDCGFDSQQPTENTYDILDRLVTKTLPDGNQYRFRHSLETVNGQNVTKRWQIAPNGTESGDYTNGSGLVVMKSQLNDDGETVNTTFEYDALQRLVRVIDAEGNLTTSVYDMLGRRTSVTHPASGITNYWYDLAGNLTAKQTSDMVAEDKKILYDYDYDRLISVAYPDHPEANVTYKYGGQSAANGCRGRLMKYQDATGAVELQYGRLGEVTQERRTIVTPFIQNRSFLTKWKYDSFGRILEMDYPDGEKVTYGYDSSGSLCSVTGDLNMPQEPREPEYHYVADIGYDKFGKRLYINYGNGTSNHYSYDPESRWLSNMSVTKGTQSLIDNEYEYDGIGNIVRISGLSGYQASYEYDAMNRLVLNGTRIGTIASYSLSVEYDDLYRVTSRTRGVFKRPHSIATKTNIEDMAYTYQTDTPGCHFQLSAIQEHRQTIFPTYATEMSYRHSYAYDKKGGMTLQSTARKKADDTYSPQALETKYYWDEEGRLLGVSENGYVSNYWYDANGERTIKLHGCNNSRFINGSQQSAETLNGSELTIYASPYFVLNSDSSRMQAVKHIFIETERIASQVMDRSYNSCSIVDSVDYTTLKYLVEQSVVKAYQHFGVAYEGADTASVMVKPQRISGDMHDDTGIPEEKHQYFYHKDHLGSTSVVTDYYGNSVQGVCYLPYGEMYADSGSDSVYVSPYKFNGKEYDEETGLYYYGARYYDPKKCMWLSPDPLQEKYPNVSSYCYTMGNPTNMIDPDGTHTEVVKKSESTYEIVGGSPNLDLNIYIIGENGDRTVLGQSLSPFSFMNDDGNPVIGAVIDLKDKKGQIFWNDMTKKTPDIFSYVFNARNGYKYDFKSNGIESFGRNLSSNEITKYHYRGMKLSLVGKDWIVSARDIGNMGAGYIAAINGITWSKARIAFDVYNMIKNGLSIEGLPSQFAEAFGYHYGLLSYKMPIIVPTFQMLYRSLVPLPF